MFRSFWVFRVLGIGLSITITSTLAEAQNTQVVFAGDDFKERFDEHGRVSGDIVIGVMIGDLTAPDVATQGMADIAPRTTANVAVVMSGIESVDSTDASKGVDFCVRINSKDGRFEAENTYPILELASAASPMSFVYAGKHAPDLTGLTAVSLVKLGHCGDRTDVVVPSVWADAPATSDGRAVHIFINSAGNPTGVAVGSEPGFIECEDVTDETTLKYTAACILPFGLLQEQQRDGRVNLSFFVTRSLGEDVIDLAIILPSGSG